MGGLAPAGPLREIAMRLRITAPDGSTSERVVTAARARLGRDPGCEIPFDPDACPMVSGRHAQIDRTADGCVLTPLSQTNQTLLNDRPIDGPAPVKAGDRIRLGVTGPTVRILALTAPEPTPRPAATPEPEPEFGATARAGPAHLALLRGSGSLGAERIEVGRGGVIGRAAGQVEFPLDHPHVSRRHARLTASGGRVFLHDLGSANGTFLNGRRLTRRAELRPSDRIDVGPFALEFDGAALVSRSRSNNIELAARKVRRVVRDRTTGKPLTLLEDINLVIRPREFVCLLGPSGSGKSTLLTMLSGRNRPDAGAVRVNDEDLYENFAALKRDIAVVPQKDVLHDSLAVGTALRYTAELRLPPDTSRAEIASSVADILEVVGLARRRGTLIRHLSGGQVKRASLANELMARPSLLFLDEVTSGLDEQTDREMMELFRELADSGKTVVCITHSLANVESTCHLVVILTEGGRLAFVGTPAEARTYFGIERLGDVYRKLAQREPEHWQKAFRSSPLYARYVRDRLPAATTDEEAAADHAAPEGDRVNPLRQAWVLTRRYVSIWRGDWMAALTVLGQALLVAILLGTVFGPLDDVANPVERAARSVNLMFLLNVACFWFGCNTAAKELVKERVIYTRERGFNLRIDSYLVSKLVVLVLVVLAQVVLLWGIVRLWCGPPGSAFSQWVALSEVAVAGTALGLLLSAAARSEDVAVALVPIAVMPQIILAGAIVPLSGLGLWLARAAITCYWAEQALESLLPEADRQALNLDPAGYSGPLLMVSAHAGAFVVATLLTLGLRERWARAG
jgi:ABC-type multidrug transport system ATPase subunit